MLILFVCTIALHYNIEAISELAADSKPAAVLDIFLWGERNNYWLGEESIRLRLMLFVVALAKRVLDGASGGLPTSLNKPLRHERVFKPSVVLGGS